MKKNFTVERIKYRSFWAKRDYYGNPRGVIELKRRGKTYYKDIGYTDEPTSCEMLLRKLIANKFVSYQHESTIPDKEREFLIMREHNYKYWIENTFKQKNYPLLKKVFVTKNDGEMNIEISQYNRLCKEQTMGQSK